MTPDPCPLPCSAVRLQEIFLAESSSCSSSAWVPSTHSKTWPNQQVLGRLMCGGALVVWGLPSG